MKIIEKIKAVWFDKVTCRKLPKGGWVRAIGPEGSYREEYKLLKKGRVEEATFEEFTDSIRGLTEAYDFLNEVIARDEAEKYTQAVENLMRCYQISKDMRGYDEVAGFMDEYMIDHPFLEGIGPKITSLLKEKGCKRVKAVGSEGSWR